MVGLGALIDGEALPAESTNLHCDSEDGCKYARADVFIKRCLIGLCAIEAVMEHLSHAQNSNIAFTDDDLALENVLIVGGLPTSEASNQSGELLISRRRNDGVHHYFAFILCSKGPIEIETLKS